MKSKKSSPPDGKRVHIGETLADDLARAVGHRPEREYVFSEERKWRFDLAFVQQKIAIEIAGRYHLTQKRFRQDCERNNYANIHGWLVLVFPASCVVANCRRKLIVEQIYRELCGARDPELDAEILTGPIRK